MAIASYLKRTSDRGNYSYRRIVPVNCRESWDAREHKVSLKTKSHSEALRRAAMVNTEFDKRVALVRHIATGGAVPTSQLLEEGKDILKREGLHPQQIPTTQDEAMQFFERQREWSDLSLDTVPETKSYDYDGSISTEYHENTKNPYYLAHEILKGRQKSSIVPTLGEATDTYLKVNAQNADRTPHNQKKHEQRVRRAVSHLDMLDTPITEFNRVKARQHKEALRKQNATWAENTLDRAVLILSAVFASATLEYELTMTNPWLGLATSRGQRDSCTSEVILRVLKNPKKLLMFEGKWILLRL
jgi:hypothetical protein